VATSVANQETEPTTMKILIVDDDKKLCRLVADYLEPMGYAVEAAHNGSQGLEMLLKGNYHAVILDVMMPQMDGFEVLKRLRRESSVPVLMLTARGEETDRIVGLEMGADDYLPKTFSSRELLARLRAVTRRYSQPQQKSGSADKTDRWVFGDLQIDRSARTVRLGAETLNLTPLEYDLLISLAKSSGRVLVAGSTPGCRCRQKLRCFRSFRGCPHLIVAPQARRRSPQPQIHPNGQNRRIYVQGTRGKTIMKPGLSLFAKILAWFFLNMIVVVVTLAIFFVFQPQLNLYAIFDQQGTDRLRTAGLLIAHDLGQMPRKQWAEVLARHAAIHRVDFMIVLEDGSRFSSTDGETSRTGNGKGQGYLATQTAEGSIPTSP
jgi:DNA-binding response OmpR family regulator